MSWSLKLKGTPLPHTSTLNQDLKQYNKFTISTCMHNKVQLNLVLLSHTLTQKITHIYLSNLASHTSPSKNKIGLDDLAFSNIVGSLAFANSRRRKSPTAKKRL